MKSLKRQVTVFRGGSFSIEERDLVEESHYRIFVNDCPAGMLTCSPWSIRQAALGHLYMDSIISSATDVLSLKICENEGTIHVDAAKPNAVPTTSLPSPLLSPKEVCRLAAMLEERSQLFHRTGGVHCAALVRNGGILAYEEDVSRHVAVEKLAGACLESGIPMANGILLFSGRVPGEIIHKAAAMGCAVIIARSAPTDYACRVAEEKNITLIGFAREDTFNIYACPHRVASLLCSNQNA